MDIQTRKYNLIETLTQIDNEELLDKIEAIIDSEIKDKIYCHTVKGEPLTKKQLLERLKDADREIAEGKFITHENLKKEVATWGK